jgi:hypothetical protein
VVAGSCLFMLAGPVMHYASFSPAVLIVFRRVSSGTTALLLICHMHARRLVGGEDGRMM